MKQLVARVLVASGVLKFLRLLRRLLLGHPALIILCYHRVTDEPFAISARTVSPREFEAQLRLFRRHFDVWPLHAVAEYLRGDRALARDTVVLTFDDGYLDDHQRAAPLLERHGLRGTFFISTAPCLDGRPYWMDRLGHVLAQVDRDRTPPGEIARFLHERAADGEADWVRGLVQSFRQLRPEERERILAAWGALQQEWVGPPVMNIHHLHDLVRRGHEIGGHGVSHSVLSRLDDTDCRVEIETCVSRFREQGIPVASFAYPFGSAPEVGDRAPELARSAGVSVAVTTEERAVRRRDDPFRLPRKVIHSQPLAQIEVKLEKLAWGVA